MSDTTAPPAAITKVSRLLLTPKHRYEDSANLSKTEGVAAMCGSARTSVSGSAIEKGLLRFLSSLAFGFAEQVGGFKGPSVDLHSDCRVGTLSAYPVSVKTC